MAPTLSAVDAPAAPAVPTAACRLVHAGLGRLRVHLPCWSGAACRQHIEEHLRRLVGVHAVEANPLTGNVLIRFDPHASSQKTLLAATRALRLEAPPTLSAPPVPAPGNGDAVPVRKRGAVLREGHGRQRRARIAVCGLDRNPGLVRRVVEQLRLIHGIRALAQPLTGHVMVEYDHHRVLLEDVLATVAHLELPDLPGEDRPEHPLDPAPFRQSAIRTLGSLLGLALVTVRKLATPGGALANGTSLAATAAGLMHLLQGFPFIRTGLRRLLGDDKADLTTSGIGIVAQTLAGFPLGLIVTGVEALILVSEVSARQAAWRRYEETLHGVVTAEPGAMIRLEAGMRIPCAARVIEGTGTATGSHGLPTPLAPGTRAPAGAEVSGGPFVLELVGGDAFEPEPRPAPPTLTPYDRYQRLVGPFSLAFATFTALRTASVARTFEALLLLNPRTAVIGLEAANLGAAARALRAGLTVVATRPERVIELPDVVLLGGPRLITDGLEIAALLLLEKPAEAPAFLALASAINAAAGSPWGKVFSPTTTVQAIWGDL